MELIVAKKQIKIKLRREVSKKKLLENRQKIAEMETAVREGKLKPKVLPRAYPPQ